MGVVLHYKSASPVDESVRRQNEFLRGIGKNGDASLNEAADGKRYAEIAHKYQDAFH